MGFRLLVLANTPTGGPSAQYVSEDWTQKLKELIPDIIVDYCNSLDEAKAVIEQADAAFGEVVPELFAKAKKLRWITCPAAGPKPDYYHAALAESDVAVTNVRGVFSDHMGAHVMSFVLAFARGLHVYLPQQMERRWRPGYETVHLPEATAVIVGVGGIGGEVARLCSAFGMTVVGVDARITEVPSGVSELHGPEMLDEILDRGDFVIVTLPETPRTQGLFGIEKFRKMKPGAYFINVGRGATVLLDDLVSALNGGEISGAALDVFQTEPLPQDHPLWATPGVLITPHVAAKGLYLNKRREEVFFDNCVRFNDGKPLRNVVDKALWF